MNKTIPNLGIITAAQKLEVSKMSVEDLKALKKRLIKSEDYHLASYVSLEIVRRTR